MRINRAVLVFTAALLVPALTPRSSCASAAPAPAASDVPITSINPVFHQLVVFSLPAHFRTVLEKTNDSFYIREHVLDGETADQWTQMITLTAAKDLASNPKVTPQVFLERIAAGLKRNCPTSFSAVTLGPRPVSGSEGFGVVASCGHVQAGGAAHSETSVMLAVRGSDDYYTLQWAERGPPSDQAPAIDAGHLAQRFNQLNPIRLCRIEPGELPPYPSCFSPTP